MERRYNFPEKESMNPDRHLGGTCEEKKGGEGKLGREKLLKLGRSKRSFRTKRGRRWTNSGEGWFNGRYHKRCTRARQREGGYDRAFKGR